ncbi:hypothetical protein ONE63_004491 [Megalurothrips usitatus]|uniref:Ubiquitin-like domain-containing protein n=1 Tax=Megalurothrips usitatus TaxID=439358 RepID=A0AAV7X9W3_9NEOP|nr:hypothetical protein ONE63_004491 [Megalurothrips usitatus]
MATITVKCINGQKVEQRVNTRTTTVNSLKQRVQESTGLAEQRQRLMHMGRNMNEGSRTLKSYNVKNGELRPPSYRLFR